MTYRLIRSPTLTIVVLMVLYLPVQAQDNGHLTSTPLPSALQQVNEDSRFVLEVVSEKRSLFDTDFLKANRPGDRAGHAAFLRQDGVGNTTMLDQSGQQHVASIVVQGNDNAIFAEQFGAQNQLGLRVEGSQNTLPVVQDGMQLQMSIDLHSVHGLTLPQGTPITQTGSGGIPIFIQIAPGSPPTP